MCYLNTQSGYSLAKIIYNVKERELPRTAKIYEAIKMMIKDGYMTRQDNAYVSEIKPLAREIQKIFEKFNIINYNEPKMSKGNKPMLVQDGARNIEQDEFELKILEEILSSNLTKDVLKLRINHDLIRQNGANLLLELMRLLIETSDFFEREFDMSRTHDPMDAYRNMALGKFKTGFKYKENLDYYKYFIKWKGIIEKQDVDLEANLRVDFPDMSILWNVSKERFSMNKQTLENDSWISGYKLYVHYQMMMWLVPLLLINKFRRIKWDISEPNWSRIILDNPDEKRTTGHGYYLK